MATALEQPSVGARRIDVMLEHLQGRRPAIEARLLACVHSVQAPLRSEDEHYRATTQALIAAVFDACLAAYAEAAQRPRMLRTARAGMGGDGEHVLGDARALVPAIVGQQAARAARAGIGADTLIRRMVAGASVMSVSLSEALRAARIGEGSALAYALRAAQSELLEAVGGVITLEHSRACGRELPPAQGRRLALVEGVLAGEAIDERELGYRLTGACHVAIVVSAGEDQLTCAALGLESLAGCCGAGLAGSARCLSACSCSVCSVLRSSALSSSARRRRMRTDLLQATGLRSRLARSRRAAKGAWLSHRRCCLRLRYRSSRRMPAA